MTSFGTRLRSALRRAPVKSSAETYLEGATSVVDLEMREREIARGRHTGRSRPGYPSSF